MGFLLVIKGDCCRATTRSQWKQHFTRELDKRERKQKYLRTFQLKSSPMDKMMRFYWQHEHMILILFSCVYVSPTVRICSLSRTTSLCYNVSFFCWWNNICLYSVVLSPFIKHPSHILCSSDWFFFSSFRPNISLVKVTIFFIRMS